MSPKIGQKLTDNPKNVIVKTRMDKEILEKLDFLVSKQNSDRSKIIRNEIENRYYKLIMEEKLKMKEKEFIQINLQNKIGNLQEQHQYVMKIIYDYACESKAIINGKLTINVGQNLRYTDIKEKVKNEMTGEVLDICLKDLENMDFLINTMINPYQEATYGIRPLGLEYIKMSEK